MANTIKFQSHWTAVPNDMIRDDHLSIEARGLMVFLMSFGDGWTFRAGHIMSHCGIGKDKYQRIMGELVDAGYIALHAERGEGGKMAGRTYELIPEPGRISRQPDFPTVGKPGPIERDQSSKEEQGYISDGLFSDSPSSQQDSKQQFLAEKFEEFRKAYPKRLPSDPKQPARKAFLAAVKRGAAPDRIVRAAVAFAKTREKEDPRFTPMASTWLNQERFEDVTEMPKTAVTLSHGDIFDLERGIIPKRFAAEYEGWSFEDAARDIWKRAETK